MSAMLGVFCTALWRQFRRYGDAQSTQRQASTVTLFAVRAGANRAPVLMKIAKEPDDGYTCGSLRQEQPAYEYNTRCIESAVFGGARQERFGVRTWHWQSCQQRLALFVQHCGGGAGGTGIGSWHA